MQQADRTIWNFGSDKMSNLKENKKASAKASLSWSFFRGKKGIELPMQIIVVVIILLVLLVFLLIFFTGQSGKLTGLWDNLVGTSINQTQAATTP